MKLPTDRLSVRDHQANDLADRHRHQLGNWLTRRGIITAIVGISPYVDPAPTRTARSRSRV
ncbi:hypothetical protein [Actinomadura alba]|uniref:hypothetical protein n=1 Tax=Actinomadura alba TaxID=406431 RepID=UPI001FE24CA4|nr:hypothetical protein [Actinomadura alba]